MEVKSLHNLSAVPMGCELLQSVVGVRSEKRITTGVHMTTVKEEKKRPSLVTVKQLLRKYPWLT